MVRYYKTRIGIYKIKENVLSSCFVNTIDHELYDTEESYSPSHIETITKRLLAKGKEITEEEFTKMQTTFEVLKRRQDILNKNIEEFVKENLDG